MSAPAPFDPDDVARAHGEAHLIPPNVAPPRRAAPQSPERTVTTVDEVVPREPEDGLALLGDLRTFVSRFVVLSTSQLVADVLWILHTHVLDSADVTPYLHITSAEKRSGKTRLLEVLGLFVARPWLTGRVTAAVLVRKVDAEQPTLLLDESDAAFKSGEEYSEALRGLLNTGHRRGGMSSLCVGQGAKITYKDFSTFCPKAIAGIGKLPDTVADRSIEIKLKRRSPAEDVERFRLRKVKPEADALKERIVHWAGANLEALQGSEPRLPDELNDRAQDAWEALFAIADLVGGDWPRAARMSSIALTGGNAETDDSLGVRLLEDIRREFNRRRTDRITTAELIEALVSDDEAPWTDVRKGKPITAAGLGRLLRPFGISSRTIWLRNDPDGEPDGIRSKDKTRKGYHRELFEDAWGRYLGPEPSGASGANENAPSNELSEPSGDAHLTGAESSEKADKHGLLTALTAERRNNADTRVSDEAADSLTLRATLDAESLPTLTLKTAT